MRNPSRNLHKEAKSLPSSKARLKKERLQSTLVQRGSFFAITAFEKGAKRLLTITFFSRIWLSLSTPGEFFSWRILTSFFSLAPRHKDIAKTWMHMNGEMDSHEMKNNAQGYPWGRLSWKLTSAPNFQRTPHQLQLPIEMVQWNSPGNTPHDKQALQMNHTLKSNNLMMPSSGYSAHRNNYLKKNYIVAIM